ncbi:MAG: hypothetical protein WA405_08340 [Candidatus Acidiferrales bacterium]
MNAKNESSGAWSAVILAAVVVLLAAFIVEFGLQTLVWVDAKHWASVNPWLRTVPQQLATVPPPAGPVPAPSTAPPKTTHLKAYNYEFTVPWTSPSKLVPHPAFSEFRFDSGQVIVFFDPQSQVDILREMKSANSPEYQRLENGQEMDSNYALYQALYAASPAQASPFMHTSDALRLDVLLLLKLGFGFDAQGGLYFFDFGKNRGFQFGDPASGRPVVLRVFDDSDNQFRFIFTAVAGSNGQITQADINALAQSLAPVPLLER